MTTIKDVAKAADVSVSTVSRALSGNSRISEKTRIKIEKLAKELGYKPNNLAKGLAEGGTHILGLIISSILNPSVPELVRGIEDTAMKRGYIVVLCNMDNSTKKEKKYIETLQSIWVDGFLIAAASDNPENIIALKKTNSPVILLVRQLENLFDTVCVDNIQSAEKAVNYLLETGCRKIAIVNGPQDVNLYRERYRGYCNALAQNGITVDKELVWEFDGHRGTDFDDGVTRKLTEGHIPDAILAASGPLGPSGPYILRAVKRFGLKVPCDISIMGFDDLEENAITDPPLSVISQPFYSIGKMATNRLINKIENKNDEEQDEERCVTLLNTEFVIRGSTR